MCSIRSAVTLSTPGRPHVDRGGPKLPASSSTSAVKYSRTAARKTGAPLPIRFAVPISFNFLSMRPTGNINPARLLRLPVAPFCFDLAFSAFGSLSWTGINFSYGSAC